MESLKSIMASASKLVLMLLAVTACVGFFTGRLEAKDFMSLAIMAFTFYFSFKGDAGQPYAGK